MLRPSILGNQQGPPASPGAPAPQAPQAPQAQQPTGNEARLPNTRPELESLITSMVSLTLRNEGRQLFQSILNPNSD